MFIACCTDYTEQAEKEFYSEYPNAPLTPKNRPRPKVCKGYFQRVADIKEYQRVKALGKTSLTESEYIHQLDRGRERVAKNSK